MVSEIGGQLNNVLHSSITVCDLTQILNYGEIKVFNLPKTAVDSELQ